MTLLLQLLGGLAAGAAAAWLFLRLLRAGIERLPGHPHPTRALLLGMLLRVALVLVVFVLVARWTRAPGLLAALAAFLVVRTWCLRQARDLPGAPRGGGASR